MVRRKTKLPNLPRPQQTSQIRSPIRNQTRRRRRPRANNLKSNPGGFVLHPGQKKAAHSGLGHLQVFQANASKKDIGTRSKPKKDGGISHRERKVVRHRERQGGQGLPAIQAETPGGPA